MHLLFLSCHKHDIHAVETSLLSLAFQQFDMVNLNSSFSYLEKKNTYFFVIFLNRSWSCLIVSMEIGVACSWVYLKKCFTSWYFLAAFSYVPGPFCFICFPNQLMDGGKIKNVTHSIWITHVNFSNYSSHVVEASLKILLFYNMFWNFIQCHLSLTLRLSLNLCLKEWSMTLISPKIES